MFINVLRLIYAALVCAGGLLCLREAVFIVIKGLTSDGIPEKAGDLDLFQTVVVFAIASMLLAVYLFAAQFGWEQLSKL